MVSVTVSDPQTEREGKRDQFTSYLVSTDRGNTIRRRYSDFQWLYGRLQTELPGALVPIIPHKVSLLGRQKKFDPLFVEERRRHLQSFLERVATHPELSRAPSMTPFMLDKMGPEFETGRKKVETSNPTSLTENVDEDTTTMAKKASSLFAKAGTMMRVRAGKRELMQTPEEEEIEKLSTYIGNIDAQIRPLVKSAEALTQVTHTMATTLAEMKSPLQEWKQAYTEHTHMSDPTVDMMSAIVEFSNDYTTLIDHKHQEEQIKFEDAMIRMGNDLKAFKIALKQRKNWQLTYTSRLGQVNGKDEQIRKATQNLKPPEVTGRLSFERSELHRLASTDKIKLEECTTRLLREAEANKSLLEDTLKEAFRQYAHIQISYTNRINGAWSQLLPFIEDNNNDQDQTQEETEKEVVMGAATPIAAPPASAPPPAHVDADEAAAEEEAPAEVTDTEEAPPVGE